MKIARIKHQNSIRWAVLEGEKARLLQLAPYDNLVYSEKEIAFTEKDLCAAAVPSKIVCAGKNYYDHAVEMGEGIPESPVIFIKTPNTIAKPNATISAPEFVDRVDYEGELAIVMRKRAKNLKPEQVEDYILGYTILNDVTARTIQKSDGQWTRGKCMDGFCPIGPWIETELDPSDLRVETRLNGAVVQSGRTSQFMTKIPELLSFITASMTLEAGDVVATGTPAGIGPMMPGDVVEIEIDGIGTLRNVRV